MSKATPMANIYHSFGSTQDDLTKIYNGVIVMPVITEVHLQTNLSPGSILMKWEIKKAPLLHPLYYNIDSRITAIPFSNMEKKALHLSDPSNTTSTTIAVPSQTPYRIFNCFFYNATFLNFAYPIAVLETHSNNYFNTSISVVCIEQDDLSPILLVSPGGLFYDWHAVIGPTTKQLLADENYMSVLTSVAIDDRDEYLEYVHWDVMQGSTATLSIFTSANCSTPNLVTTSSSSTMNMNFLPQRVIGFFRHYMVSGATVTLTIDDDPSLWTTVTDYRSSTFLSANYGNSSAIQNASVTLSSPEGGNPFSFKVVDVYFENGFLQITSSDLQKSFDDPTQLFGYEFETELMNLTFIQISNSSTGCILHFDASPIVSNCSLLSFLCLETMAVLLLMLLLT